MRKPPWFADEGSDRSINCSVLARRDVISSAYAVPRSTVVVVDGGRTVLLSFGDDRSVASPHANDEGSHRHPG